MPQAAVPLLGMALGVGGGMMQMNQQRQQARRLNAYQDAQSGLLGQANQSMTGPLSAGQQQMLGNQREQLRSGQAMRGIFDTGVGAQMEAQTMPGLEDQLRQQQMQAFLAQSQGYNPLISGQMGRVGQGGPVGAFMSTAGGPMMGGLGMMGPMMGGGSGLNGMMMQQNPYNNPFGMSSMNPYSVNMPGRGR